MMKRRCIVCVYCLRVTHLSFVARFIIRSEASQLPSELSGAFNLTCLCPLGPEKGFLGKIKGFLTHSSSKLPHFLPAIPPMPTPLYLCHTALLAKTCSCSWLATVEDKHTGQAAKGSMHQGGKRNPASGLHRAILGFWDLRFPIWRELSIRISQSAFHTLHPYKAYNRRSFYRLFTPWWC